MEWRKSGDTEALKSVIDSELNRKQERLNGTLQNNVWELRNEPPKDWNRPLPDWMNHKLKDTYLDIKQNEKTADESSRRMCVIS